jgi:hypothetical protein
MKKYLSVFAVLLFFPFSAFAAFGDYSPTTPLSGSYNNLFSPGGSLNPIHLKIVNPPSYCNYVPSFAAGWSGFSSCAPVVAQRGLQNTLQQLSENIYQQNKMAQQAQKWSLFNMLRPVAPAAPVVVQVAAAQSSIANEPVLPQSNDQRCKAAYGQYSVWDGTLNSTGGPQCGCSAGYEFSTVVNRCVPLGMANSGCDENECWVAGASGSTRAQ